MTDAALSTPAPTVEAGPFVKWVGGKGRVLRQLIPLLPADFHERRYIEPFVGGGALFFATRPARGAILADVNWPLMYAYKIVRDGVDALIDELRVIAADTSPAASYYARREHFNSAELGVVERAALFICLNKTCFNGLYRVNRAGKYNVPEGRYVSPRILDEPTLRAASAALQCAELKLGSFDELTSYANPDDFVYLDPPFADAFTGYSSAGFGVDDQRDLARVFATLAASGCKLMLSNSDTPLVRELYGQWSITEVRAAHSVSRDGATRGKVTELVIRNY